MSPASALTPSPPHSVLFIKDLMEKRKYRAVIDRCYPLERVVDAARYVETRQKTGNVVLTLWRDTASDTAQSQAATIPDK